MKINSRKLWAWLAWGVLTVCTLIFARDYFGMIIPWYGAVTTIYVGGQAVVDAVAKSKGR